MPSITRIDGHPCTGDDPTIASWCSGGKKARYRWMSALSQRVERGGDRAVLLNSVVGRTNSRATQERHDHVTSPRSLSDSLVAGQTRAPISKHISGRQVGHALERKRRR